MKSHLLLTGAVLLLSLCWTLGIMAQIVEIPDNNLRAALEKALGKNEGDAITKEDLAGLKKLEYSSPPGGTLANSKQISDILY